MFGLFSQKDPTDPNVKINNLEQDVSRLLIVQDIIRSISNLNTFEEVAVEMLSQLEQKMGYSAASISVTNEDSTTIELKYLSNSLVSKLSKSFLLDKTVFDPIPNTGINQTQLAIKEERVKIGTDITQFIVPPMKPAVAKLIQAVSGIKTMIAVPIRTSNKIIGVLNFSMTKSQEEIGENEFKALNLFMDQLGIIIDNTQKRERIENFNLQLKHDIEVATSDLKTQNTNLESLFKLTSNISKTLDPTSVAETAVDTVPQDELLFGTFLNFYNKVTGEIYMKALTKNTVSEQIEKLIGGYDKYKSNVNDEAYSSNPIAVAVKTGQMQVTNSLAELMSPPMPKALVLPIQKLVPVTSAVVYPLKFRNDTVGTITFLLKSKTYEELEDNKKQLLSTYALQIGIALENANLFTNLGAALDQLKEARRRERDMLDVMGHELRTPISIVRNALLMLDRDYTKTDGAIAKETLRKYLDMAIESVRREITLIETLLSATKIDASRMQLFLSKVDFKDVVGDGIEGQRMMVQQKGLTLNFNPPTTTVDVFADRTRTQEIMDNFLSNSAKYTNTGSINISVWADDNYGYISIKDTGMGISEEDLQNLGKKFFRAKQYIPTQDAKGVGEFIRPGGTGLGLYVTFDLIRIMGGRLYINSKVGEGSVFTFSLPKYKDQKDSQIDETFSSDATAKKEHVFLNSPEAPQPPQA